MRISRKAFATMLFAAATLTACAQRSFVMNLWTGAAPNDNGNPADTAKVSVFLPKEKVATGRAVVICPGGGYQHLAMKHEGTDWAPFFNNMGIAAIVLKYRMPNGNHEVPVADAEEALRLVRRNAQAWNIKTDEVGIMGSSAGGHLASTLATHSKGDAKPDFQILFYPVITMMPDITHKGSHDNFLGRQEEGREGIQQRRAGVENHAARIHRPRRRRPGGAAGKRSELLHGAVPPRRAGISPRIPLGRPRVRHPRELHVPQRDAAGTQSLAKELLISSRLPATMMWRRQSPRTMPRRCRSSSRAMSESQKPLML